MNKNKLFIPCLRGQMGDWVYYSGLMSFEEISKRVKLPKEIDKKYEDKTLKLDELIQRQIVETRTKQIVEYLTKQDQRFFNSLILGIFDGKPSFQEIQISNDSESKNLFDEETYNYLSKSFGILTLEGNESIFAIDGQHRVVGIREALKQDSLIRKDEVSVIFVAHKMTQEGVIRTRRLFSTLNRYAKPVNKSEIIALSEDDNCAVITRKIIDEFDLLKNKIIINKNRSINIDNKIQFTNILSLYDIIERILTNKKVLNIAVSGENSNSFINNRISDTELKKQFEKTKRILKEVLTSIPSFNEYLNNGNIDRKLFKTNLIFRPIGQNILFDVVKIATEHSKKTQALEYFAKDNFNLNHHVWKSLFWDTEINNIRPEKTRQRYATILILEKIGVKFNLTKSDKKAAENFKFSPKNI